MSKQDMTGIEIHYVGRWVIRTDFEGLTQRLGAAHAEDVWDIVAKHGVHEARSGLIYLRCAPLIERE